VAFRPGKDATWLNPFSLATGEASGQEEGRGSRCEGEQFLRRKSHQSRVTNHAQSSVTRCQVISDVSRWKQKMGTPNKWQFFQDRAPSVDG